MPTLLSPPNPHFLFPSPTTTTKPTIEVKSSLKNDNGTTAVNDIRVAFAAGGTGGHIYPAVAIAEELKIAAPTAQILFLGRPDSMESAAVAAAGFDFAPIPVARLHRPKLSPRNLAMPFDLVNSVLQTRSRLREFRPDLVVGTGGYVSFPTCLAAAIPFFGGGRAKMVIQEQNSVPGIANLALSRLAEAVFLAFGSAADHFPAECNCVVAGNPVRLSRNPVAVAGSKGEAVERFFPGGGGEVARVVAVLGGSQGSSGVNLAVLEAYRGILAEDERVRLIWQTGVRGFDEMESLVKPHPRLHLAPFIHSMDALYRAADLIVSRAGAMTCSEILAHGKPSILIPSPYVAEGHQFKNASMMEDLAGSRVILEEDLDSTTLKLAVLELLGDERKLKEMSEKALKAAKPNAAAEIVRHILSIIGASSAAKKQS